MYIYVYEPVNWQIPTELPIYIYFTIRRTASKNQMFACENSSIWLVYTREMIDNTHMCIQRDIMKATRREFFTKKKTNE